MRVCLQLFLLSFTFVAYENTLITGILPFLLLLLVSFSHNLSRSFFTISIFFTSCDLSSCALECVYTKSHHVAMKSIRVVNLWYFARMKCERIKFDSILSMCVCVKEKGSVWNREREREREISPQIRYRSWYWNRMDQRVYYTRLQLAIKASWLQLNHITTSYSENDRYKSNQILASRFCQYLHDSPYVIRRRHGVISHWSNHNLWIVSWTSECCVCVIFSSSFSPNQ